MCTLISGSVAAGCRCRTVQRELICRIGVDRHIMLCLELHGTSLLVRRVGVYLFSFEVLRNGRTLLLKGTALGRFGRTVQRRASAQFFVIISRIAVIVGIFTVNFVIVFFKSVFVIVSHACPYNGDDQHDDQNDAGENHQDQDSRNAGGEFYICIQFAAFVGALAENAVYSYRRLSSHITCFHGSGIVLQNAGFVLFDVVDAADSNAVGVDVLGSVVRSQYAQNSVVLGNRISFFIGGSDHGSVLVDRSRSTGVID